ncbi:MAG: ATP-grasp domain-containing protein [Candidatus Omnitrophica bacterium]|nr:ATP-grasp domain-containing protein [Candidatus Omnitrophota bacterium]
MVIGMTFDLKTEYVFKKGDPADANAEFDHPSTIQVIEDALTSLGHKVVRIGNVRQLLDLLPSLQVDLVFNIAEGQSGRNRESQVPILLEMHGIPYVGSDGLTQALTLDKLMAKKIFQSEGIPTPSFFTVSDPGESPPKKLRFPLIVKPRFEGSSKGMTERSVVRSRQELKDQIEWVCRQYRQPALVEQFIAGTEYTVAIVGNHPPEAMPVVQVKFEGQSDASELFYTHARIASGAEYVCPASIGRRMEKRLKELALQAYRAVECVDFGRVDFRVDRRGNPYVLEINPLPSLSTEDVFQKVANHLGITYPQVLGRIVSAAAKRLGLREKTRSESEWKTVRA